jgi:hypothetical protein
MAFGRVVHGLRDRFGPISASTSGRVDGSAVYRPRPVRCPKNEALSNSTPVTAVTSFENRQVHRSSQRPHSLGGPAKIAATNKSLAQMNRMGSERLSGVSPEGDLGEAGNKYLLPTPQSEGG